MLDHLGIGVADLEATKAFFLRVLAPLGVDVAMEAPGPSGWGARGSPTCG